MSRKCVPQLAVDERMVALFRIIDPDIILKVLALGAMALSTTACSDFLEVNP